YKPMIQTFTIRLSLILLLLFTLPIATMRLIGEQINPYYGLGMFASDTDNDVIIGTLTYLDLSTQVGFISPVLRRSKVRLDVIDDQLHIYVRRNLDTSERLVTTFDTQGREHDVQWRDNYLQTMYITLWDDDNTNAVDVYRLDVPTGEVTFFRRYTLESVTINVDLITDDILLIRGADHIMMHNLQTDEIFTDRADRSQVWLHNHHPYWHYTQLTDDNQNNRFFVLDSETFTPTELHLPTDISIASLVNWSPTAPTLLILDADKRIWLYDARIDEYRALATDYQLHPHMLAWSNLGERLIVTRPVEDYVVEVGLYTLADDNYLPLFQHLQVQNGFQTPAIPRVQWSPDDRVVFVSPPFLTTTIQYTLYDTTTGEIILEHSAISNSRSNKTFFWVSY
ncbi:MAG: hypothetical protein AAFV93_19525, partial [Chloroflexota bacterium]